MSGVTAEQLARIDAWNARQLAKAPRPTTELKRAIGTIVAKAITAKGGTGRTTGRRKRRAA